MTLVARPTRRFTSLLFSLMAVAGTRSAYTFTRAVTLWPSAEAVIRAIPVDKVVTLPSASTVATEGSELVHATAETEAFSGSYVTVSSTASPTTT